MSLYGAIDLHGNNSVTMLIDEADQIIYQKRLTNHLPLILESLAPFQAQIQGIVVESTFNWYWLVDGLMEAGYRVHLANPSAIKQYEGLKYTNDFSDAQWLAHMLRLGILPQGHIYPKATRAIRDVLRKRCRLVEQQTANLLSIQNILWQHTGTRLSTSRIQKLTQEQVDDMIGERDQSLSVHITMAVVHCLSQQIKVLEKHVRDRLESNSSYELLQTVKGIGPILAQTIVLETGHIERFPSVGNYASYCRCVDSAKISNGKRKGKGNVKNGNPYLSWAYAEAAYFAIRFQPQIQRYYQRKLAQSKVPVARKAVAHKLARACYYMMQKQEPFDVKKAFG